MRHRINKPNKYCKLYSVDIEFENQLNDPEVRLLHLYLRIVDWDIKHIDTYGYSDISIVNIKKHYLNNWSTGKISETRQSLIKKGWLVKKSRTEIGVREYRIYRLKDIPLAEQCIRQIRQGLPIDEQLVQFSELSKKEKLALLEEKKTDIFEKMSSFRSSN